MIRWNFGGLTVIWQVIWPMIFYSIVTTMVAILAGTRLEIMWILVLSAGLTSAVLYCFYSRMQQLEERPYGVFWRVRQKRGSNAVLLFVLAASLCVLLNNLIEISGISGISDSFDEVSADIYGASVWLQILAVGLAAPVVEELIFRGLGYGRLRRGMGMIPAAVISSLIFALYHGNLVQAVYGFWIGIALAVVYEHFDGLISAIWLHASANLASIALSLLSKHHPDFFEGMGYTAGGTIISGLLAAGCFFIIYTLPREA